MALPRVGRHTPVSTYRLQLTPDFTFNDAQGVITYLKALGITDLYLSPILQAVPGSRHGYDVVDHSRISEELGAREGFEALATSAHDAGLHVIVDIVPNHMAVPTPLWLNQALWSVLSIGRESPYATWFDLEEDGQILMPVLGARIGQVLTRGELSVEQIDVPTAAAPQWVLRYFDHVFPIRSGTESLPLTVLLERQHYRLAHWKVGDEQLNYRRFFDVDTLAGIRVERPEVFDATHSLLLDLFDQGHIDGFRVDHPDGLADPRGYFQRLADRTQGAWIVAEKILDDDEQLPSDWEVSGTTGYDTAWRLHALQVDSRAATPMGAIMDDVAGDSPTDLPKVIRIAKEQVIATSLTAEVRRVADLVWAICQDDVRLRDHTVRALYDCLRALIIDMHQYRAYVVPGQSTSQTSKDVIHAARERAMATLDAELTDTMDVVIALVLGEEIGSVAKSASDERRDEVVIRFQQVCGAVMAKGVEDTAFYRWTHLISLTEVGGSPAHFGLDPDAFHAFETHLQNTWPATMTAGTTHDSKRGEDVRARLAALTSFPQEWAALVAALHPLAPNLDGRTENLLWQTLAATSTTSDPLTPERLRAYLTKAVREQKEWTTWTAPDLDREAVLLDFAEECLASPVVSQLLEEWRELTASATRTTILVTKALQLTLPGVADVYQGTEITRTSLVDPDNRRPVDFDHLQGMLASVRAGRLEDLDAEKFRLTAAILRLRALEHWAFVSPESTYHPLPSSSGHAIAFSRGDSTGPRALTVATRHPRALADIGGWVDQSVVLPTGRGVDIVSGRTYEGGAVRLASLLSADTVVILSGER